jgi:hypothetical protein
MVSDTTKPDSWQPAAEMAVDLFDNWFDPIRAVSSADQGWREAAGHQRPYKISTVAAPNSHAPAAARAAHGVVSLAISEIGERCEAEDDHESEHDAGRLNSMHLPVG